MGDSKTDSRYTTKYFFRVLIVLGIPTIYVIYSLFDNNYISLSLILSAFLYLLISRNVKSGLFLKDYLIVFSPFMLTNRQKKISYDDMIKVKRGSSYYEGESLIIYFKSGNKQKKIVLGYPSENNKVGIINILKSYDINIEGFY